MIARTILKLALALTLGAATAPAQDTPTRTFRWPDAAVDAFARLPVQDGGRIKPLATLARYVLLRLAERSSVEVPDEPRYGELAGARLSPTRWAMDLLLHPDQADGYPVFAVVDREVLDLVGLADAARGRRDRYAFAELRPGLAQIELRARAHVHTEAKQRTRLQNQLVDLYEDVVAYRGLRAAFEPLRLRVPVPEASPTLRTALGAGVGAARLSDVLGEANRLMAAYRARSTAAPTQRDAHRADLEALDAFLSIPLTSVADATALHWLPPADPDQAAWFDLRDLLTAAVADDLGRLQAQVAAVAAAERVVDARSDPEALAPAAVAFGAAVRALAHARGEGLQVDGEVAHHRRDPFGRAQALFVLGLLLALLAFAAPRSRIAYVAAWTPNLLAVGFLGYGVAERCMLRGRPPVTTLYETILFVTATMTLLGLGFEAVVARFRAAAARRIALALTAALGALGMFLAARHEAFLGEDTMPQLQAVLDTNFWLSTHVTTVTLGYMAALLAGFVGHVYLIGRLLGWRRGRADEVATYRWLGRMTYAALCFAVLMATVGTILGGVWANDSWGRFWGWDPKENGALMIVLWNLGILHGRFAGFWRDHGIAILAVCGNVIVAFSWWGVNLMGVGLHSYGFQSGLKLWVTLFYVSQAAVAGLGGLALLRAGPGSAARA